MFQTIQRSLEGFFLWKDQSIWWYRYPSSCPLTIPPNVLQVGWKDVDRNGWKDVEHIGWKNVEHIGWKDVEHIGWKDVEHIGWKDVEHIGWKDVEHTTKFQVKPCFQVVQPIPT